MTTETAEHAPPAVQPLTKSQARVFDFLQDFIGRVGYAPSIREISAAFGFSSNNAVWCHLRMLERKGRIRIGEKKARAIAIVQKPVD